MTRADLAPRPGGVRAGLALPSVAVAVVAADLRGLLTSTARGANPWGGSRAW